MRLQPFERGSRFHQIKYYYIALETSGPLPSGDLHLRQQLISSYSSVVWPDVSCMEVHAKTFGRHFLFQNHLEIGILLFEVLQTAIWWIPASD